jgi:hypothetical protein
MDMNSSRRPFGLPPDNRRLQAFLEEAEGSTMRRTIVVCAALLSGVAGAQADQAVMKYYDRVRPHRRPRSDAIHQADLNYCYNQTGADRNLPDTPAFKKCMLGRGYRWLSTGVAPSPSAPANSSSAVTYNRDSKDPTVGWHWEGGSRVCHNDCDNPEIPGSGFTSNNVVFMGMATRKCTREK